MLKECNSIQTLKPHIPQSKSKPNEAFSRRLPHKIIWSATAYQCGSQMNKTIAAFEIASAILIIFIRYYSNE
jgi:hypothetical protein